MAKIVGGDQYSTLGVVKPSSIYSRVICVWCQIKGVGETGWGFTPPLGQSLRLISVKMYFSPEQTQDGAQINYGVHVGHTKPIAFTNIQAWDPVVPIYRGEAMTNYYRQTGESSDMSWQMNQNFAGKEIRFGTWINGSGFVAICEMYTFFEISEG